MPGGALNYAAGDPATIIDAGSSSEANTLYREGAGYIPISGGTAFNYSFVRNLSLDAPKDSNQNESDLILVSTTDGLIGSTQSRLGFPGPENTTSPISRSADVRAAFIAPCVSNSTIPNRERNGSGSSGTLRIRRRFTNSTGRPLTRLRFRIVDLTVLPSPAGTADLRVITSGDEAPVSNPCGAATPTQGVTLEMNAQQSLGGGLNSTLSAETITLGTPLAPTGSFDVNFLMNVAQPGSFRFFVVVEALTDQSPN